jgi:hypothetical protein
MDEMPIWFDIADNFTINSKSEKIVHICVTGNKKNQFIIILTCMANKNFLKITFFFLFFYRVLNQLFKFTYQYF